MRALFFKGGDYMPYELRRINGKRGEIFSEITFDLWNDEYNEGYEIKLTIGKYNIFFDRYYQYARSLVGKIYPISTWDKIIRDIKQNKIEWK